MNPLHRGMALGCAIEAVAVAVFAIALYLTAEFVGGLL